MSPVSFVMPEYHASLTLIIPVSRAVNPFTVTRLG